MKILLERHTFLPDRTLGRLYFDGQWCVTLEDTFREIPNKPVSEWKVQDATCIPTGSYYVTVTYSNRFKTELPLINDVEGFTGIRIHAGNTPSDTSGCILVGSGFTSSNDVFKSRVMMDRLMNALDEAYEKNEIISIEVRGKPPLEA